MNTAIDYDRATEFVVPRILDPNHGWFFRVLWGVLIFTAAFVVGPLFTDLFARLHIESPLPRWDDWGPAVAGIGGGLVIVLVSGLAGTVENKQKNLAKALITFWMLFLAGGIAAARFAQGLVAVKVEQRALYEQARVDVQKARTMLDDSSEARVARANLERGAKMFEQGRANKWPIMRNDGKQLMRRAETTLARLQKRADRAEAEAQARMDAVSPARSIPMEDVLRLVVGPTLTEIGWTELTAISAFFLAIWSARPIILRTREEYLALAEPKEDTRQEPVEAEPVEEEDVEDVQLEPEPAMVHPHLEQVNGNDCDEATLLGLDWIRGTWLGIDLSPAEFRRMKGGGGPKRRYPVLAIRRSDGKAIYAGTVPALRLALQIRDDAAMDTENEKVLDTILALPDIAKKMPHFEYERTARKTENGATSNGAPSAEQTLAIIREAKKGAGS